MRLYSYVVAQDYGFAPNPFHGVCTLATCKPRIRESAKVGDCIVGIGAAQRKRSGHLVFFMRVAEITDFDHYWSDSRFQAKRPYLYGSKKQAFGDNIYHTNTRGKWIQEDSYHSKPGGEANPLNLNHDTKSTKVLIGTEYVYWGGEGPKLPPRFLRGDNEKFFKGRSHRIVPERLVAPLLEWITSLNQQGCVGKPLDWRRSG